MKARRKWNFIWVTTACIVAVGNVKARTVNWYSTPGAVNLTSSGQVMDGGFQFTLGSFSGGFIPSAGNVSEWSSRWVAAQTTSYNAATKFFDSNYTVTGNAPPFTTTDKGYIWGRRISTSGDEWILFRKSNWLWPTPDPFSPFPLLWSTATADPAILGTVHATGSPFLMKSEAILSYNQWRDTVLLGQSLNAPNDDPDQDSLPNLLEFAFGTSPLVATPPQTSAELVDSAGQSFLQLTVPRLRNRLVKLTVEVSNDLAVWNSGSAHTTVVTDTANSWIIRDLTPSSAATPQRFMRLKAELAP